MAPPLPLVVLALVLSHAAHAAIEDSSPPSPLPSGPVPAPSAFSPTPSAPEAPGLQSPFHSPPAPPSDDNLSPDEAPSPSPYSSSPSDASPSSESPLPSDSPAPAPSGEPTQKLDKAGNLSAEAQPSGGGGGGMSGGQKAGLVVGVMMAATLVGLGAFVYKKRQDNVRRSQYGHDVRREML
ncbi:unnamed protein product [Spirodela intermedia]|uniref:Uncharacterized protein n=1 Tax=Spirodela intermedia TaxID=51605 RepID=A0A7I8K0U8_SPIIN|nr:unnamed protein product [Spirodela intermedia]